MVPNLCLNPIIETDEKKRHTWRTGTRALEHLWKTLGPLSTCSEGLGIFQTCIDASDFLLFSWGARNKQAVQTRRSRPEIAVRRDAC